MGVNECGAFANLKIDTKIKELSTTCKSGPRWFVYTYKFNKAGNLF